MGLLKRSRPPARKVTGICEPWEVSRALDLHGPLFGGSGMTDVLLDGLHLSGDDDVIEFWPGRGETTRKVLPLRPRSYRGIAPDERTSDRLDDTLRIHPDLRVLLTRARTEGAYTGFQPGCAESTGLPDDSASVIFGECLLTPLAPYRVKAVIREAVRLLPPGGRFGVHELCLIPNPSWNESLDATRGADVCADLDERAGAGLFPQTEASWRTAIGDGGLVVTATRTGPVEPLTLRRLARELGPRGFMESLGRMARNAGEAKRLRGLSYCMAHHQADLGAIVIIAERPLIGDLLLPDD
jgi:SAM-dependent methyltransferase